MTIAKILIILGIVLILIGLLFPFLQRLGFGHFPGDISVKGKNFFFYFPIVTSIIVSILLSVILTLILWLFKK